MSTIEKVYSEERAHGTATNIPSLETPLSPKLKALARRLFGSSAVPAAGRPEQQCWDDAFPAGPSGIFKLGDPLTPVYNEYVEEINGERNAKLQAEKGGVTQGQKLLELSGGTLHDKVIQDNRANFKAMTKAELMLHLRDDGITHTMTAMRKMTKAKLETIAFMRSVVIPEDGEG